MSLAIDLVGSRIKLLSGFVIKISCNICKGKISTFMVLERERKERLYEDNHFHPRSPLLLLESHRLRCGKRSQMGVWQFLFDAKMGYSQIDFLSAISEALGEVYRPQTLTES